MTGLPAADGGLLRSLAAAAAEHVGAGRLTQALECYRALLRHDPDDATALRRAGMLLIKSGQLQEAADLLRRAAAIAPDNADLQHNLGRVLHDLKQYEAALVCYQAALALNPDHVFAHNNRGIALVMLQRHAEAAEQFRRALALDPGYLKARANLAGSLLSGGNGEAAIAEYRKILAARPADLEAQVNLARALGEFEGRDEAVAIYQAILAQHPHRLDLLFALAELLRENNRAPEALALYRSVTQYTHSHEQAQLLAGLSATLQELGRLPEAIGAIEMAAKLQPDHLGYHAAWGRATKSGAKPGYIDKLRALMAGIEDRPKPEQIIAHFAMGDALAERGEHAESFRHYLRGNALRRSDIHYSAAIERERLDNFRAAFTADWVQTPHGVGSCSALPIFIVGMPRSGSTLVEQVLFSHPAVLSAGEVGILPRVARPYVKNSKGSFPQALAMLGASELAALGDDYVREITKFVAPQGVPGGVLRITDKMLGNYTMVPLIKMILPHARIIHTRRDPIDTCMSCFSLNFAQIRFSFDLAELGAAYRGYSELMQRWREILPADAMLEVDYEDTVADFETQARRIIAYCGLEWDDACLRFHQSSRSVRTSSVLQVRQPIYKTSVGRWRPDDEIMRPLLNELAG